MVIKFKQLTLLARSTLTEIGNKKNDSLSIKGIAFPLYREESISSNYHFLSQIHYLN